ncbi:Methyltransferase-16, putative [Cordyceps militaris CM01]|uniref:Methyltransferase-16, putative n=1 Tax=Cordyceps militaris (strain CM01) TaxID=983644 RepID=G3JDZ3_CORMM|nr:Methyltransferase-16, putative [Cordyceps militaris CM01]EGX92818.1 Methyltransferase-16, putative [Cordyceps militaris CM01]
MTYAERFASILEPEIEDPEEGSHANSFLHLSIPNLFAPPPNARTETFLLYSQPIPSSNLGFVDPRASTVEARVGGADYTIHQSPGVLSSNRAGGTTGAGTTARPPSSIFTQKRANTKETCALPPRKVLWKISPVFADWLASPANFLFRASPPFLDGTSAVLELGCGISPLNAFALAPRVASHTLTDQAYVQRFVQRNLDENTVPSRTAARRSKPDKQPPLRPASNIAFATLDWETDSLPARRSYDAVLAVDCVYNYALIPPLVQTCAEACRRRTQQQEEEAGADGGSGPRPSLCIVAQQLRNDDVFRTWLAAFVEAFYVWRVPDDKLPEALRPSAGFVVHIGILRD